MDVKDAEGEEATEGRGDVAGGVEDGQAAGEFASSVEDWTWSGTSRRTDVTGKGDDFTHGSDRK